LWINDRRATSAALDDAIARALATNETAMTHLCFWCNCRNDPFVSKLAKALTTNTTLRSLRVIGGCYMLDAAAAAVLGEMLAVNKTLCVLNLGGCSFEREGEAALVLALGVTGNTRLEELTVSCTGMRDVDVDAAAHQLARVLRRSRTLRVLDMRSTLVGDGAVYAIADSLRRCLQMERVDVYAREETVTLVRKAVARCKVNRKMMAFAGAQRGAAWRFLRRDGDRHLGHRVMWFLCA
jgi:hypothetical protein